MLHPENRRVVMPALTNPDSLTPFEAAASHSIRMFMTRTNLVLSMGFDDDHVLDVVRGVSCQNFGTEEPELLRLRRIFEWTRQLFNMLVPDGHVAPWPSPNNTNHCAKEVQLLRTWHSDLRATLDIRFVDNNYEVVYSKVDVLHLICECARLEFSNECNSL